MTRGGRFLPFSLGSHLSSPPPLAFVLFFVLTLVVSTSATFSAVGRIRAKEAVMSLWRPSTLIEAQLEALAAEGAIPSNEVAHWRAPPPEDVLPHPRSGEVVTFRIFYARGLGHPAHAFLMGLFEEWKIELQHLNPIGLLHIANFVTVCEAFLGIDKHVDLFREMFIGRPIVLR